MFSFDKLYKILFYKSEFIYWLSHVAYRLKFKILIILGLFMLPFWIFLSVYFQTHVIKTESKNYFKSTEKYYLTFNLTNAELIKIPSLTDLRMKWVQKKLERMSKKLEKLSNKKIIDIKELDTPNYNIHIFYYAWFRNLEEDGFWNHWQTTKERDIAKNRTPPDIIDSSYYPKLGSYSSKNLTVLEEHMKMIKRAGIGVLVLSWVPPPSQDSPRYILNYIMDLANKYHLKVCLQFEDHDNRSTSNILKAIKLFLTKFGKNSAVYRMEKDSRMLPVFYVQETFRISHISWKMLLSTNGNSTIRGSKYDGIFLAHFSEFHHGTLLKAANFDGFYTFSSANGMSYGSTWKNWGALSKFANEKKLMFIPCIGPGYASEKESKYIRHRLHGSYYEVAWRSALGVHPKIIGISSFNNWEEGSQIEPAVSKRNKLKLYYDYEPEGPNFYIDLTLWWNKKFLNKS